MMSVAAFALKNGIARTTLRDWMKAYNNINGKFINVKKVSKKENNLNNFDTNDLTPYSKHISKIIE